MPINVYNAFSHTLSSTLVKMSVTLISYDFKITSHLFIALAKTSNFNKFRPNFNLKIINLLFSANITKIYI